MPQFSEDDVMDFKITEAIAERVREIQKDAREKHKETSWKEEIKPPSLRRR